MSRFVALPDLPKYEPDEIFLILMNLPDEDLKQEYAFINMIFASVCDDDVLHNSVLAEYVSVLREICMNVMCEKFGDSVGV